MWNVKNEMILTYRYNIQSNNNDHFVVHRDGVTCHDGIVNRCGDEYFCGTYRGGNAYRRDNACVVSTTFVPIPTQTTFVPTVTTVISSFSITTTRKYDFVVWHVNN